MQRILILFSLMLAFTYGTAQDKLVYIDNQSETILTNNITISNNFIEFEPLDEEGLFVRMNIGNVSEIVFNQEKPIKIVIQKAKLKHQECFINQIADTHVQFHLDNGQSGKIETDKLFYLSFHGSYHIPKAKQYEDAFLNTFNNPEIKSVRLNMNSGKTRELIELSEIKEGFVYGKSIYNDIEVGAKINIDKVSKIVFVNTPYEERLESRYLYLLSSENKWEKVSVVKKITPRKVFYSNPSNDLKLTIEKSKAEISGLFFYNPEDFKRLSSSVRMTETKEQQRATAETRLDFNLGWGYLLAETPDWLNNNMVDYYDELRSGFTIDAGLTVYPWKSIGFGAKFNSFKTNNSSSDDDYFEFKDDIKVSFIGGGVSFKTDTHENDVFWAYLDVMAGYLAANNDFEFEGESGIRKGSNIGYYLSPGLNLKIDESVYLTVKAGLLLGGIKKYDTDGEELELDEPDSMARLDGMAGLTIMF